MAKNTIVYIFVFVFFIGNNCTGYGQSYLAHTDTIRGRVISYAKQQVGKATENGRNNNPLITIWNERAGVNRRSPYCASFVFYSYVFSGFVPPIRNPATAASWFINKKNIVWTHEDLGGNKLLYNKLKPGMVLGYKFVSGRISHISILLKYDARDGSVYAYDANTSNKQTAIKVVREGDNVYYTKRRLSQVSIISDPLRND